MTAPDPALLTLAGRALQIVLRDPTDRGQLEIAMQVIERIDREHGSNGVLTACLGWCDTLHAQVPALRDADPGKLIGLSFQQYDTGVISTADQVPPGARWAGRFLLARVRMDEDAAMALWHSFTDGRQVGTAVAALLSMVASNLTREGHEHVVAGIPS